MGFDYDENDMTGSDFDRPTGVQQAVLSHIIDLGLRDDKFHPGNQKHQGILVWQLAETYEKDGKQIPCQQCEFFTSSLNEKSKLRRFVEGMLGVKLTAIAESFKAKNPGKKFAFKLEAMIGKNCMLTIAEKDGKSADEKYTYVQSCAPLMKNLQPITVDKTVAVPSWIKDMLEPEPDAADMATDVDLGAVVAEIS